MVADDLLKDLNSGQQDVVRATDGPLLVLAGAGTGKTRCIIYRAAYLIATRKVRLENLLIVTFTNKAARELRQRLAETFGIFQKNLWVGTFHSLFSKILRFESEFLPVNSNYVIYDEKDQKNLVSQLYKTLNIDSKQYVPRVVRSIISNQKNSLIFPEHFWEFNKENPYTHEVYRIYKLYQAELIKRNAMDFDDILAYMAKLLDENPAVRSKWNKRFRYIMIDEYQDTNYAQFKIINYLAQEHQNLCVVGDDDQAIYTWRGATIKNILNFEYDYKNVKVIRLERNYRSHKNILALSNSLIQHNAARHEKELYTDLVSEEMPRLLALDNENEEAGYIAEKLNEYHKKCLWQDCAILYRTNAQSRVLEKILVQQKIPYQIYGEVNFFQRKEVKDVLCYLRLLVNHLDLESLNRALSLQKGVGKTTIAALIAEAELRKENPYKLVMGSELEFLKPRAAKMLKVFSSMMHNFTELSRQESIPDLLAAVLDETEIGAQFAIKNGRKSRKTKLTDPELISRQENLLELITGANEFNDEYLKLNDDPPSLTEYLNSATLQTDLDTAEDDADMVKLMTMHNAKGLEFEHVFIIGLEDGLLPHSRSIEEDLKDGTDAKIEEERRLLYVGITRAKKTLTMTLARWRRGIMGNDVTLPSRFIKDFDERFLNEERYDPYAYFTPSRPKRKPAVKIVKVVLESEKHYKIGQKIKHSEHGTGEILNVDGKGKNALLTVKFEDGKVKKIVGNYVELI
ncbi:MAG: UvrD-helicase domain-containing protein [Candidatus Cloacimonetes bacterium]|nr:UvrD-helicase domain-containing protein [Candidatus Cloacimonadota bacterium]